MQKLVFSRCSGKLGTATRHQGPKTGTVWSVRENPSKSPKRPALQGAVNREGAVSRHRPFVLLANHTPFRGANVVFPTRPVRGRIWPFGGRVGYFPHPGGKPATTGRTGRDRREWVVLAAGREKAAAGFYLAAALWGLLEILRFFFLRLEQVLGSQVIRLLFGNLPAPLAGVDGAVQFIRQAVQH